MVLTPALADEVALFVVLGLLGRRVSEVVQNAAQQFRVAPGHLAVVQGELEVAVRLERDEAFCALAAQVHRLIESDVLEVARVQDREEQVVAAAVEPGAVQDLPAGRDRVRHVDVAEGQAFQAEADAVSGSLPQGAILTDRIANVVKIRMFHRVLMVAVARFFSPTTL